MKLLWISRMGYQCSYSYVSSVFLSALTRRKKSDLEIYAYATGIVHTQSDKDLISKETGVKKENIFIIEHSLLNSYVKEDQDYFNNYFSGIYFLNQVMETIKPDIVISLDDSVVIENQIKMLNDYDFSFEFKFIPYLTIDHTINIGSHFFENSLVNSIMTMTNFGLNEIKKSWNKNVNILYHIVDSKTFYIQDKSVKKKWSIPDGFIIGAFNANNIRKRWDILLEGFGIFASKNPNTYLLIKVPSLLPSKDKNGLTQCPEYNLRDLINSTFTRFNLSPNRIITIENQVSEKELNELYNCCDVGLTTTSGEGFGLTPCEMSLCEIPQILPEYSSFPELFEGTKGLMPVTIYPVYVGRHMSVHELRDLPNKFACIYKSYIYYLDETEEHETLSITDSGGKELGIPTFIVAPFGTRFNINLNIKGIYSTFEGLIAELTKVKDHRYQVLINLDIKFLSQEFPHYKKLKDIKWKNRKNYIVNESFIEKYYDSKFGEIGIVDSITVSKYLEKYYLNPKLRKKEGKKCKKLIEEKCNSEDIVNKFLEIIFYNRNGSD